MRLLTENEFHELKQIEHYETYIEKIKASQALTLEMIADAIYKVMQARLMTTWRTLDSRERDIMYARHYGRYIAYTFSSYATATITRFFGNRDHSVIYNSLNVIKKLIESGKSSPRKQELEAIIDRLNEQIELQ
jgi:chromosomal replication initiation ATPase DnaA